MKRNNANNEHAITSLISEYEVMSQKGTVGFYEETVFLTLIEYYQNDGKLKNALEVIEYAQEQHPYSASFFIKKAQIYIEQNCEELALDALKLASVYAPSEVNIHILRAEALGSMKLFNEAFDILNGLSKTAGPLEKSEVYLSKALLFESMNQFKDMFIALTKSVLANPENKNALERVWYSVEMSGEYDASILFHQKVIDLDPYSYIAWYNLGFAYAAKDEHANARDAFEYAFIINEKFEFAYRDFSESCIKLGQYQEAIKAYDELLEHFDADCDLYIKLGLCYLRLQQTGKAKTSLRKAAELDPFNDLAYFYLGEVYMEENKLESAITSFKKAIYLDGTKEEYLAALAEAFYQKNDHEKANLFFQKATDTAPDSSIYWIQYASFLLETGKGQLALEILDEAELYTFGPEIMYCRIACLFSLGKRQEGLFLFGKALSDNYKMHDSLFDLLPALKDDFDIQGLIASFQRK